MKWILLMNAVLFSGLLFSQNDTAKTNPNFDDFNAIPPRFFFEIVQSKLSDAPYIHIVKCIRSNRNNIT